MDNKERLAWQMLLDVLEGYGFPFFSPSGGHSVGLCEIINCLMCDVNKVISKKTADKMIARIYNEGRKKGLECKLDYLWPAGDLEPRIKWIRKLMKDNA